MFQYHKTCWTIFLGKLAHSKKVELKHNLKSLRSIPWSNQLDPSAENAASCGFIAGKRQFTASNTSIGAPRSANQSTCQDTLSVSFVPRKWVRFDKTASKLLDVIYKTEALRITTTFDVSYKMRLGGSKIIKYLDEATKEDNNVLVSKFIDLLKANK